jgi:predicted transcriptional regulator
LASGQCVSASASYSCCHAVVSPTIDETAPWEYSYRRDLIEGEQMATFDPVEQAADVVVASVSNNSLPTGEPPACIQALHAIVVRLASGVASPEPTVETRTPAVSLRKSITPDYLTCLEDGKRCKSLRRRLTALGMTPEQYRAKWNLPSDYPMIAPNYAAQRSALAKKIGPGRVQGKGSARKRNGKSKGVGP